MGCDSSEVNVAYPQKRLARPPRVLVLGDAILDKYIYGHATRLCPEGPVPVVVPERETETGGGACLVVNQLDALLGGDNVWAVYGSQSTKTRIFADDRLVCRIDRDSTRIEPPDRTLQSFLNIFHAQNPDLIVISDYGKDALNEHLAGRIFVECAYYMKPILVDAKNNFSWYGHAFAFFPNALEFRGHPNNVGVYPHIIRKLGPKGCSVDDVSVPLLKVHDTKDTTGAGDCFLAAFAAKFATDLVAGYKPEEVNLISCAKFANQVAARSVEFVGTHIVTDVPLEVRI